MIVVHLVYFESTSIDINMTNQTDFNFDVYFDGELGS